MDDPLLVDTNDFALCASDQKPGSEGKLAGRLVRTLGFGDLLFVFLGSVIGSGIFLTPSLVLRQVGISFGASLVVWVVGGALSLMGALTYAELAAANPEAGGIYCYIRDGFGRLPAFLYGWCLLLVIASGSIAALARAFSRYLAEIIPLSPTAAKTCAVSMIGIVTLVNIWGTRKSSNLQNWTTLAKVILIIVLSVILLSFGHHFTELSLASDVGKDSVLSLSTLGIAMITVLWAYEGWQFGTYAAGEVKNPQRNFPRAFLAGSLALIGLYLAAVVGYVAALGPQTAANSDAIAATAVAAVLGPWAGRIVAVTIVISTFSAANSTIMTAPRVFYAMARNKLFFRQLGIVHPRFATPAFAVVTLGVWSAVLACIGGFAQLINSVIFIGWIFYGLGAASIFPMRRALKSKPLTYRVPGYPATPLIFIFVAVLIVGNAVYLAMRNPEGFVPITIAISVLALGFPAYFFWRKRLDP